MVRETRPRSESELPFFNSLWLLIHDGIYGVHTGAGMSNARLIDVLLDKNWGQQLTVCPIYTSPLNPTYDDNWFSKTQTKLSESGSKLQPLDNGTQGEEVYGDNEQWLRASQSAMALVETLCITDEKSLIVSFDTPFIFLDQLLTEYVNLYHVHIPRSTGMLHDPNNEERLKLERTSYLYWCHRSGNES